MDPQQAQVLHQPIENNGHSGKACAAKALGPATATKIVTYTKSIYNTP